MMLRCIDVLLICSLLAFACKTKPVKEFKYHSNGIPYKLLAFEPGHKEKTKEDLLLVSLSFSTQKDSLFWDSYNNFNDLFVISARQAVKDSGLRYCLSSFDPGDSLLLLVPAANFFREQFHLEQLPEFCAEDTVVKVHAKIQGFISDEKLQARKKLLREREAELIQDYLKNSGRTELKADSNGVIWLQKPDPFLPAGHKPGEKLKIQYEGRFLNGRLFERSASDFDLFYALPDQVIKGLNYVMHFLHEGQNAKIILPSALAFGDAGSSNGTVPPYTPVLYQINCIQAKQK